VAIPDVLSLTEAKYNNMFYAVYFASPLSAKSILEVTVFRNMLPGF
jgi:hypothetical protein